MEACGFVEFGQFFPLCFFGDFIISPFNLRMNSPSLGLIPKSIKLKLMNVLLMVMIKSGLNRCIEINNNDDVEQC